MKQEDDDARPRLIGAVAGDVVGSVHEGTPTKSTDFPLLESGCHFTDDTVLTVATAAAILDGSSYGDSYRRWSLKYPRAGYGFHFTLWMRRPDPEPYRSYGNGSAMRVAPVGLAFDGAERVLEEAARSASCTHDHPEGIKGAQAVALAVFRARTRTPKEDIRAEIAERFGYDLARTVEDVRPGYKFDVRCQGSVPEALLCFFEADSTERAIRLAVSLGGDADTQACIAGGIAEVFHRDLPVEVIRTVRSRLPAEMDDVLVRFDEAITS